MGFRETMEHVTVKKEAGMGMGMGTPAVSMKLLIDTKAKRVLFAEAGKECVDFLFQILSLPVATIIHLLGEEGLGIGGSWPNLYKSLENLDSTYIVCFKNKDPFLKPAAQVPRCCVSLLALEGKVAPTIGNKFYKCGNCSGGYFSDDHEIRCPSCNRSMNTRLNLTYVAPPAVKSAFNGGGIVQAMATFMVMDDLEVKPMSKISTISLINDFNIQNFGDLKEKVVNLGMNEALKLLKASHQSKNVLTDVFC